MNTTAVCEYVPCARRCDPSRPHRAVLVCLAIGTSDALAAAGQGIARRLTGRGATDWWKEGVRELGSM